MPVKRVAVFGVRTQNLKYSIQNLEGFIRKAAAPHYP